MRDSNLSFGFFACLIVSGTVFADSNEQANRKLSAEQFMATFCVTDRGLGISGGTTRTDGSVHFSHLVQLDNNQLVDREYDVSRNEMHIWWRDTYAEILTTEELAALIHFCHSDNAPLRSAFKKRREIASARRFMATMNFEIARNPSLAPFESAIAKADKRPEFELSKAETQALAELNESALAQSAIKSIDEKAYKRASAKLWQIGLERGVDTPHRQ